MTKPKRARELHVGDVLPDGAIIIRIAPGARGYNIQARCADGSIRRMRYAPDTIVPEPDDRHPSRFADGHPWARKGRLSRSQEI